MLKQRKVSTIFGMAKIVVGQASPYVNWLQLGLVSVMSFYTTINPLFASWGIQLPFWVFLSVLGLFVMAVLLNEYLIVLPSYFGAANIQMWYAENPQRELMEKIERELAEIKQLLKEKNVA